MSVKETLKAAAVAADRLMVLHPHDQVATETKLDVDLILESLSSGTVDREIRETARKMEDRVQDLAANIRRYGGGLHPLSDVDLKELVAAVQSVRRELENK